LSTSSNKSKTDVAVLSIDSCEREIATLISEFGYQDPLEARAILEQPFQKTIPQVDIEEEGIQAK
jgi:hypothetical protein